MLKILVAEDQLLIQKDIVRKIEKTGKDVEIIGTAINGEEALVKLHTALPDLLITDIRMPVTDGLSLIRKIRDEGFPIFTVILSGYRDFDYAKEALKLQVDDYLLKPVSIEDLSFVLDSIEEKKSSREDTSTLAALKELAASRLPPDMNFLSYFKHSYYHLLALNLDSFYTLSIRDSLPYEASLEALLNKTVIRKYLKKNEQFYILDGNNCNEKLILFCLDSLTGEKLDMLCRELIKGIEGFTQAATICVSNRMKDITSLGLNRQLLQTQIKNQLIYAHSALLFNRNFLNDNPLPTGLMDNAALEKFRFHIRSQNLDSFLGELGGFLTLCASHQTTQKSLESYLKKLVEFCFPSIKYSQTENLFLEIEEYISNSRTYGELYMSLSFLFNQLYEKTVSSGRAYTDPKKLSQEIKQYIQDNFRRDININDIAAHFSITPAYISRLFKKYSDTRPIEYLMNCRINQACQYFRESSLSVREVAELCGYSNQYYFSKAFKQVTSYSPSEYRIRYQEGA